jgi:hypothetical protein
MEDKVKRKYRIRNKQKTHKEGEIYEDFVNQLLIDYPDYFAVKPGYWDNYRTVFTIKKESLKDLKEYYKDVYDTLVNKTSWRDETSAKRQLLVKLEDCSLKLKDIKNGKQFHYKIIDFTMWREAMCNMNMAIQDKLINAQKYKVCDVGTLEIVRIERSPSSYIHPRYKWMELDDYVLLTLQKFTKLKNKHVYFARPTFGDKGVSFKCRLFDTLRANPSLRNGFRYISLESLKEKNKLRINSFVKRRKKELEDGILQNSIS